MTSKKRIMIAAIAGAMAAALIVGGSSFAYLKDNSETVTNNFETNKVLVDLTETDNEYTIIPGTTQDKDPEVAVDNTVDAWLFVSVYDNTDGLVGYEIADGWTALDGHDGVYYREVAANAATKEFYVLKNNKVTYDAALENADLMDGDDLKTGVTLSFKAFAIQKEGFATAAAAFEQAPTRVTNQRELDDALANAADGASISLAPNAEAYKLPKNMPKVSISGDDPATTFVDAGAWFDTNASNTIDADVSNVTFVQPEGKDRLMRGSLKGQFKNCVFDNGSEWAALYAATANGDLTFTKCQFVAYAYACNFGTINGNVTFNDCDFTGWNSFGKQGTVTFNNCRFHKSAGYGNVRLYQDAFFNTCTFDSDFKFVDGNNDNITITFTGCTGLSEDQIFDNTNYPEGYVPDNITWIVDGVELSRRPKH